MKCSDKQNEKKKKVKGKSLKKKMKDKSQVISKTAKPKLRASK